MAFLTSHIFGDSGTICSLGEHIILICDLQQSGNGNFILRGQFPQLHFHLEDLP